MKKLTLEQSIGIMDNLSPNFKYGIQSEAWDVIKESLKKNEPEINNSPYTMFKWSTDNNNQPIILLNGEVFNYDQVIKLRNELNRLIPPEK